MVRKKTFQAFSLSNKSKQCNCSWTLRKNLSKFVLSATYLPGKNFSANFLWKNFRSLQFFVTLRKIILYCVFKTVVQLHRGDNLGQKYEFLEELGLFVFFFLFWEKTFRFEIFYLHSAHPGEQIHWKRLMKSRKKSTNFGKLIGNYFNWSSEKSSLRVQCNNFRGKASIFPKKTACLFLLTE